MLKVLLFTDNCSPAAGGAEKYFFELKDQLEKANCNVYMLGFADKIQCAEKKLILKSVQVKLLRFFWQIMFHPVIYYRIRKYIKTVRPDVIHLHHTKQYTLTLFLALRGHKVIQTVHDFGAVCPTAHNIHRDLTPCATGWRKQCFWQHQLKFNRLIYLAQISTFLLTKFLQRRGVQFFFAPSPQLADLASKYHQKTCYFIPPFKNNAYALQDTPNEDSNAQENGALNHQTFKSHSTSANINSIDAASPAKVNFFFAGNLGAHKGVFTLIQEFAIAYADCKNLTLTIAGSGSAATKISQLIQQLQLSEAIHLVGWQSDLAKYYQQCSVVIFPSIWMEAFGLVMLDAMLHSRPIIGSNRGSPTWLIEHKKTGLIFDPQNKGSLAKQILWCAQHPQLTKQMGKAGHAKIHHLLDNDTILANIFAHYKS